VTVLVPAREPRMVELASARKMRLRRNGVGGAMRPARWVTATRVPMLSKRSTKRKTKIISKAPMWSARGCRGGRRGLDGGEVVVRGLPVNLVTEDAEKRSGEDADEHGGSHTEYLQDCDEQEAEDCQGGAGGAEVAEVTWWLHWER